MEVAASFMKWVTTLSTREWRKREEHKMDQSVKEVAERIARAHLDEDPSIQRILFAEDVSDGEIHLIEVSNSVAEVGEIFPFKFKPQEDVPYPLALILLHPSDWEKVESGELQLPDGFEELKEFDELEPRAA